MASVKNLRRDCLQNIDLVGLAITMVGRESFCHACETPRKVTQVTSSLSLVFEAQKTRECNHRILNLPY